MELTKVGLNSGVVLISSGRNSGSLLYCLFPKPSSMDIFSGYNTVNPLYTDTRYNDNIIMTI